MKAFESIVRKSGRKPQRLQTDKGKEFYNTKFQSWLNKEGICHFSMHGDAKASLVARTHGLNVILSTCKIVFKCLPI